MSNRKDHKAMKRRDKIYKLVLQSSTKGMRADEIAEKLPSHRTTVYRDLSTLNIMGKVESDRGIWRAKTGEQPIPPLEKEIVIELPIPKNDWQRLAFIEGQAKHFEENGFTEFAKDCRIILDKYNETRTIRIKGKNVDYLSLEKIASLIQQANEKTSKPELKGIYKILKRALP